MASKRSMLKNMEKAYIKAEKASNMALGRKNIYSNLLIKHVTYQKDFKGLAENVGDCERIIADLQEKKEYFDGIKESINDYIDYLKGNNNQPNEEKYKELSIKKGEWYRIYKDFKKICKKAPENNLPEILRGKEPLMNTCIRDGYREAIDFRVKSHEEYKAYCEDREKITAYLNTPGISDENRQLAVYAKDILDKRISVAVNKHVSSEQLIEEWSNLNVEYENRVEQKAVNEENSPKVKEIFLKQLKNEVLKYSGNNLIYFDSALSAGLPIRNNEFNELMKNQLSALNLTSGYDERINLTNNTKGEFSDSKEAKRMHAVVKNIVDGEVGHNITEELNKLKPSDSNPYINGIVPELKGYAEWVKMEIDSRDFKYAQDNNIQDREPERINSLDHLSKEINNDSANYRGMSYTKTDNAGLNVRQDLQSQRPKLSPANDANINRV